jgi:dethiobiotin synthetase
VFSQSACWFTNFVSSTALPRIIFITGTDTGVGKTVLTCLLLDHLRRTGCHALAMKPFCTGGRSDTELLYSLQDGELTAEAITPFCFSEPLAPLIAARKERRSVTLQAVLQPIKRLAGRCDCLLVEGIGGLLVPLGPGFTVRDLIARLRCQVIVVSRNQLGTINHTLLTIEALKAIEATSVKVALMSYKIEDCSTGSNGRILTELLSPVPVVPLPFLGAHLQRISALKESAKKMQKSLARILA